MEYKINSSAIRLEDLDAGQLFTFRDSSNKLNIPTDNLCMTCKRSLKFDLADYFIVNLKTGIIFDYNEVYQDWVNQYKQQSPVMLKVV